LDFTRVKATVLQYGRYEHKGNWTAGEKNAKNLYTRFLGKLSLVGFYALVVGLLPALIFPFSLIGALFILLMSLGIVYFLALLYTRV